MARTCDGHGCHNEAKLKCPKCIGLSIDSSFCSQECFKTNYNEHKLLHFDPSSGDLTKYQPYPGFDYTGKLRPYPRTGPRKVPDHIMKPDYADHPEGRALSEENIKESTHIKILNEQEIESMRLVSRLAREVLEEAAKITDVGVTTDEIDRVVHEASVERDCYPSPLNYYKFPKSCCTSVNEVICHGIPDKRPLENGDIVNIDVTVYHKGFHGDLSETLIVGEPSEQHKKLVQVTWECLQKGIEAVKPGVKYREIGDVIQKHASAHGFSVVKSYCGHGIHRLFHTAPKVPHYAKNKTNGVIRPGHTFTIEPMIAEGNWRDTSWPDDWTAVTVDGLRSAQFEETLLATETGCEILTRRRTHKGKPYFMASARD
jgi:methionyl aminopeptidase